MRTVLKLTMLAMAVSLASASGHQLAAKLRGACPQEPGNFNQLIASVQVHSWAESFSFPMSQIASHQGVDKSYLSGAHHIPFRIFQDLPALQFGTHLEKIHMDHKIQAGGLSVVSVIGVVGSRAGTHITGKVVYGYITGSTKQLTGSTVVRKCKKRFLRGTHCWNETVHFNRGFTPEETMALQRGLDSRLFNDLANKAAALGRL